MPGNGEVLQLVSHSLGSKLNFSHLVFEIKIGEIIVSGPIVSDLRSAVLNRTFEYVFLEEHFPSVPEELSSAAVTGQREAAGLGSTELYVQEVARSYGPLSAAK